MANEDKKGNARPEPIATTSKPTSSRMDMVQKALLAPFTSKKRDSAQILSDLAPVIMTPRMMSAASPVTTRHRTIEPSSSAKLGFATLGRAPLRLGMGARRLTSRDLEIVEAAQELLAAEIPEPDQGVSLLRGFNATIPSADSSRTRRRQMRNVETPKLGLKKLGMNARGLLTEEEDHEGQSVASDDDVVVVGKAKGKSKRKPRESLSTAKTLGKEELSRQTKEIMRDKENLHVKRSLINSEILEITHKIKALNSIRAELENDLLKLQEDELELDDEMEGVKDRLEFESTSSYVQTPAATPIHLPPTRRRKGPAFLPSEHDELPPGVAFMTLESHLTAITALDFSEPYGTLVTASQEDSQPRVWDLFSGTESGRLRGHEGGVACIQVEDHVCLTGGQDGTVRLWDLRRVQEEDDWNSEGEMLSVPEVDENENVLHLGGEAEVVVNRIRSDSVIEPDGSCVRVLEGHTKAVTALYFEDECLVTGASDKTLRQWDLTTGQCVMTMDILWAISHPPPPVRGQSQNQMLSGVAASVGAFSVPSPPAADGSWDMYTNFVGGVQFWGYGLVSASGDGAVRMWDMRTGQAHRTLLGHTAPVTCLQFDEMHIISGSLDKTIRIWDLRTGGISDTLKYDHGVTALQFDSRKIIAATGENGVKIFNRTSMQHSTLQTNGHTRPVERLRFMDRYLVSGGRDSTVKIWSL